MSLIFAQRDVYNKLYFHGIRFCTLFITTIHRKHNNYFNAWQELSRDINFVVLLQVYTIFLLAKAIVVSHFSYTFSFIGTIIIRSFFVYNETLRRLLSRISKIYSTSCQPAVTIFTALCRRWSRIFLIYQFSLKHKNSILCQCLFFEIIYSNKPSRGVLQK